MMALKPPGRRRKKENSTDHSMMGFNSSRKSAMAPHMAMSRRMEASLCYLASLKPVSALQTLSKTKQTDTIPKKANVVQSQNSRRSCPVQRQPALHTEFRTSLEPLTQPSTRGWGWVRKQLPFENGCYSQGTGGKKSNPQSNDLICTPHSAARLILFPFLHYRTVDCS